MKTLISSVIALNALLGFYLLSRHGERFLDLVMGSASNPVFALGEGGLTPEQEQILGYMSLVDLPVDHHGKTAPTIRITGANLQVVWNDEPYILCNGTCEKTGVGNVVVGYQEAPSNLLAQGSHNLVVGTRNAYPDNSCLLVGDGNRASKSHVVVAGVGNEINNIAYHSAIWGGKKNEIHSADSAMGGGTGNVILGSTAGSYVGAGDGIQIKNNPSITVAGGAGHIAMGPASTITGGAGNSTEAAAATSSIHGGAVIKALREFTTAISGLTIR